MVPYSRNLGFIDRESIIERVQKLAERETHNRIALCGLGGSGYAHSLNFVPIKYRACKRFC